MDGPLSVYVGSTFVFHQPANNLYMQRLVMARKMARKAFINYVNNGYYFVQDPIHLLSLYSVVKLLILL